MRAAKAVLLLAVGIGASQSSPPPFRQDRFAISFWVDPMVPPERFDGEYARIASANFTVLLGGFGATTVPEVQLQIAAASRAGLAAVPSICHGACANLSGAWGFQIADEPAVPAFASLVPLVADAKASGRLGFVNLLPNYATPVQFGAASYGEYVAEFVRTVKPNLLSVDHYPNFGSTAGNKTKAGYIDNLMVLREAGLGAGIGFWNFFNAMPYGGISQYDITEAELRWQVYTSLAMGSKGVLYFCYWTPPGSDFLRGQAIMTPTPGNTAPPISDQVPGSKFPLVQRINSKLKVLGDYLLDRVSSAVLNLSGQSSGTSRIAVRGSPVVAINGTETGPDWSYMLGFFDGNATLLLMNQDSNHPGLASLELTDHTKTMMEVDSSTGVVREALDDSPYLPGFQVSLLAGDARLFSWQ